MTSEKNVIWQSIMLEEEPENCLYCWIFKTFIYWLV